MYFRERDLSVNNVAGDFLLWASDEEHQCTELRVIRPRAECKCKVRRLTFTCFLRKQTATQAAKEARELVSVQSAGAVIPPKRKRS